MADKKFNPFTGELDYVLDESELVAELDDQYFRLDATNSPITGDTEIQANLVVTGSPDVVFAMSNSPLRYDGVDYDGLPVFLDNSAFWFSATLGIDVPENFDGDGTTDIDVVLIDLTALGAGNLATIYYEHGNLAGIETFLDEEIFPADWTSGAPKVESIFTAHGGADYTYNDPTGGLWEGIVSGYTDPATIGYTISDIVPTDFRVYRDNYVQSGLPFVQGKQYAAVINSAYFSTGPGDDWTDGLFFVGDDYTQEQQTLTENTDSDIWGVDGLSDVNASTVSTSTGSKYSYYTTMNQSDFTTWAVANVANINGLTFLGTAFTANGEGEDYTLVFFDFAGGGTATLTELELDPWFAVDNSKGNTFDIYEGEVYVKNSLLALENADFTVDSDSSFTLNTLAQINADLTVTGTTTLDSGLTGVAHLTSGVVSVSAVDLASEVGSSILQPANGGTGVNNGVNTLTLEANSTINQDLTNDANVAFNSANVSYLKTDELRLDDLANNNFLTFQLNEDLTGDKTLNLTVNDANRNVSLSGNLTIEGDTTANQDLTTDAPSVQFGGLSISNGLDVDGATTLDGFTSDGNSAVNGYFTITAGTDAPAFKAISSGSFTNNAFTQFALKHVTDQNGEDGLGTGFSLNIEDNTSGEVNLAGVYALRNGADNKGQLQLWTNNGNAFSGSKVAIDPDGLVRIGNTSGTPDRLSGPTSNIFFSSGSIEGHGTDWLTYIRANAWTNTNGYNRSISDSPIESYGGEDSGGGARASTPLYRALDYTNTVVWQVTGDGAINVNMQNADIDSYIGGSGGNIAYFNAGNRGVNIGANNDNATLGLQSASDIVGFRQRARGSGSANNIEWTYSGGVKAHYYDQNWNYVGNADSRDTDWTYYDDAGNKALWIDANYSGTGMLRSAVDFIWEGDGSGIPYGAMYMFQGSTTITVSSANTWYELTSGCSAGSNLNLMTFGDSHYLAVAIAGRYEIKWSVGASADTHDEIMGAVTINGADDAVAIASTSQVAQESANHTTVANGAQYVSLSGSVIVDLAASDQISLVLLNESAAQDISLQHVTLTATMVGGT